MPTFPEVYADVQSRLTAGLPAERFTYANGDITLPDNPAAFAYVEIILNRAQIAAFGGGRGSNLQRTTGRIEAHVMEPTDSQGAGDGYDRAEAICAVFRGTKLNGLSVFSAQAMPTQGRTEDGAYAHVATASIEISFDQPA